MDKQKNFLLTRVVKNNFEKKHERRGLIIPSVEHGWLWLCNLIIDFIFPTIITRVA
jgi:hypothetical protein